MEFEFINGKEYVKVFCYSIVCLDCGKELHDEYWEFSNPAKEAEEKVPAFYCDCHCGKCGRGEEEEKYAVYYIGGDEDLDDLEGEPPLFIFENYPHVLKHTDGVKTEYGTLYISRDPNIDVDEWFRSN